MVNGEGRENPLYGSYRQVGSSPIRSEADLHRSQGSTNARRGINLDSRRGTQVLGNLLLPDSPVKERCDCSTSPQLFVIDKRVEITNLHNRHSGF